MDKINKFASVACPHRLKATILPLPVSEEKEESPVNVPATPALCNVDHTMELEL
jgi:hypothetical protein